MQAPIPTDIGWTLVEPLRAVIGVAALCLIAWACSSNRRRVPWRVVIGGLGLQLVLAGLILGVPATAAAFEWLARQVATAIGMADAGSAFLFGPLAAPDGPAGFVFAFRVLPVIVYFAAVMGALYHLGIMQRVVAGMAWVMRRTLGVSGAESLTVAANVLVGQTEAPLCVKPFLPRMTRSQLMVVMTGGFATIAGSVLAGYVDFLGGTDEAARVRFAKHLLTASIMSAPAAFVMAKLMLPETESEPLETISAQPIEDRKASNVLDAVVIGATDGLKLALNVGAMLVAFIAILALLDWPLEAISETEWIAGWRATHGYGPWSVQGGLGILFQPIAWCIGAPAGDVSQIGRLLGTSIVATEFVAYADLRIMMAEGTISPRGVTVVTYALCGFANIPSMAIQIGGLGAIAPSRRADFSSLAPRAMLAGALACWSTAAIASAIVGSG
jgi:CNT family concentrative nucleoside transporter